MDGDGYPTLDSAGIETRSILADDGVFTTLAFVTLDGTGNRELSFARKPGADTQLRFEDLDLSLTDEPARSATYQAVAYAKSKGKLITYDPNLRKPLWRSMEDAKQQLLWGLRQADIVKISNEEVEFLFGLGVKEGAAHILEHYGVKLVFATCGADGYYFQNRNACGHVPSLPGIRGVDTTGAGDIFGGSALWKLLQSRKAPEALTEPELREAVAFACASAGLSTTKPGGISSIPEYGEAAKQAERLLRRD